MDLPMPVAGQSSNISDKQQTQPDLPPPAVISGLDDTLNNDFFYDDEFTVPFDANLTEDSRSLPPGVDSLLRRLLPGNVDDDNEDWRRSKMALSKSDSCLYQADQELSDSEREMSMSEHEYSSSSNNSPLQNQSLFSSCGEPTGGVETSVCNVDGVTESVMSGSLTRDSARYNNYDWTLNKQQYVLMFDRSPTKTCSSEEDSCHQMADSKTRITSWSRAKSGRQKRRVEEQIASTGGSPTRKAEREKGKSCLTTWGQLKGQQESSPCATGGLTTWQQVKQTNTIKGVGRSAASSSDDQLMETVLEELSTPPERAIALAVERGYPRVKLLSPVDETGTGTLVNIYCKMKTQEEMSEFENNEAMASPLSLEKLLETWTESLELAGPERTVDVVYNSSRTDLIPVLGRASKVPTVGGVPSDYASKIGLDNMMGVRPRQGDNTNGQATFGPCNATNSTHSTTTAQQAGSPVLTSSLLRGHDTVDCSIQFPPASMDRSVQTSFTFSESQMSLTESKAQQTSVIAVAVPPNPRSLLENAAAAGYSFSTDNKMVLSAHPLNRPLPDLSFLKKTANPGARKYEDIETTVPKTDSSRAQSEPRHPAGKQPITDEEAPHAYGKPLFQCRRPTDVKASSSSDSRDSSPRPVIYRNRSRSSDSTSTYSVCSTSSSGIDPGFYDSSGSGTRTPRMSRIFDDGGKTPVPAAEVVQKTPPKPPRLYTASSESHLPPMQFVEDNSVLARREQLRSGSWSEAVAGGLCTACSSRIASGNGSEGAKALASSHPVYFRDLPSEADNFKPVEYLQVSPTHAPRARRLPESPPATTKKPDPHQPSLRHGPSRLQRSKEHVMMRGSQQQIAKPAKSILVRRRQRNQAKHRSWSNPACDMDDLGPRHGYLPSYLISGDRRPVSLPDENLLHQTQSGIAEEHGAPSQPHPPQRWKSQNCLSHELVEGNVTSVPEDIVKEISAAQENDKDLEEECDGCDCEERFKAKKSVSFSEKIFYHSTSATTSPLDSPRCPQVALLETTPGNAALPAAKKSVECKNLSKRQF